MSEQEFNEIVSLYRKDLIRFIVNKYYFDNELAEDIVQNTFIKAYNYSSNNAIQMQFVKPWLYTISINLCNSWLRVKSNRIKKMSELIDDSNPDLNDTIIDSFSYDNVDKKILFDTIVNDGLKLLKDKNIDCYNCLIDSLESDSYLQLSEKFEIPLNTVKTRIFRARQFMKNYLEHNGLALSEI